MLPSAQDSDSRRCLIVGLGNPGSKYEETRHNLGFKVVQGLAAKLGLSFKKESRLQGLLAQGNFEHKSFSLLLPTTYMNLSGIAVRKAIDYYRIPFKQDQAFLVVVDEVYLKFGTLRLRAKGSSGGHNGLKSIEQHLQTQEYARLRMGVGPEKDVDLPNGQDKALEDYVLGQFTSKEKELLPQVITSGVAVLECWLRQGLNAATQMAGEVSRREGDEPNSRDNISKVG